MLSWKSWQYWHKNIAYTHQQILLEGNAEKVFLTSGKLVLNVDMALPLEKASALLNIMLESRKGILEDKSMKLLITMATNMIRLKKSLLTGH